MPQNAEIVLLILAAVLALIGIVGGNIKIFGAEVESKVSHPFLRFLAIAFSFILIAVVLHPPGSYPKFSEGNSFKIVNKLSGKCIDVAQDNSAVLQLWDCKRSGTNPTEQNWEFKKDGFFNSDGFIVNKLSNKCIDVPGAPGRDNGAVLRLWKCEFSERNDDNETQTDQRWEWLSTVR